MASIDPGLVPLLGGRRAVTAWMVLAFLVTFLVTRFITHAIRAGRGPFRNVSAGGVHVHHEVYGIFLMLIVGAAEFTYLPGPPWREVLAVLFGVGAALTLDEFALWLRLDDVYWSREGRSSVDAVLVALVVGGCLLAGANPFDSDRATGELPLAITIAVNLLLAVVAIAKGRVLLGVVGVFVPVVALVAAVRLARPTSPWARRRYASGSRRQQRAVARFPPGRRPPWAAIVDLFAAAPVRGGTTGDPARP